MGRRDGLEDGGGGGQRLLIELLEWLDQELVQAAQAIRVVFGYEDVHRLMGQIERVIAPQRYAV